MCSGAPERKTPAWRNDGIEYEAVASFTYGQIGALNAESFCERVL